MPNVRVRPAHGRAHARIHMGSPMVSRGIAVSRAPEQQLSGKSRDCSLDEVLGARPGFRRVGAPGVVALMEARDARQRVVTRRARRSIVAERHHRLCLTSAPRWKPARTECHGRQEQYGAHEYDRIVTLQPEQE